MIENVLAPGPWHTRSPDDHVDRLTDMIARRVPPAPLVTVSPALLAAATVGMLTLAARIHEFTLLRTGRPHHIRPGAPARPPLTTSRPTHTEQ